MNSKVRLDRLRKLQYLMEHHDELLNEVNFNMTSWCFISKKVGLDKNRKIKFTCQTAACALGSAGLYPPFRRSGLKTDINANSVFYKDKGHDGYYAGHLFFGITLDESKYLFLPSSYIQNNIRKHHVITRIKRLIKKYTFKGTKNDNKDIL